MTEFYTSERQQDQNLKSCEYFVYDSIDVVERFNFANFIRLNVACGFTVHLSC